MNQKYLNSKSKKVLRIHEYLSCIRKTFVVKLYYTLNYYLIKNNIYFKNR